MDKKDRFTAKIYKYVSGELHLIVQTYDRLEDAIEAGIKAACHSFKVYGKDGCVHHDSHHHHHHSPYC